MEKRPSPFSSSQRDEPDQDNLTYRTGIIRATPKGGPSSLNEEDRSVEVVGATENPTEVWDWDRWDIVTEVLLMSGAQIPASRQVILLDNHQRYGSGNVIGSYRDMRVEGPELIGRAHFTTLAEGDNPFVKVKEGHLTDFSAGYRVLESEWIPEGETANIQGRKYKGPLKVSTRWVPKEMSITPIGADELAKARSEHNKPIKRRVKEMNEELKKRLIARGLNPDATDEEAWEFLDQLTAPEGRKKEAGHEDKKIDIPKTTPETDEKEFSREAVAEERKRVAEISAMCRRFDVPDDLRDELISDGTAIDEARSKVMDDIEKRRKESPPESPGFLGPMHFGADERDKFRDAARDGLIIRSGAVIEKPAPGADELAGYRLVELARMALRMAGERAPAGVMEMVGRAMVTGDFPYILANVANKSLFEGWDTAAETWQEWCGTGPVSDFKTHYSPRASETDDLLEVPPHGEYKYGERGEAQEQYSIATYGRLFAITRQTIINDDLGALTDTPRNHGEAAARKIGDLPYAVLIANAAMGDGTTLFHANHGNLGTGGAVSETTIGEAIKLAKVQKDILGKRRLNIRLMFFIAPAAIEGHSEIFFQTLQYASDNKGATRKNIYAGTYFQRVYEPRLDDDSATAYYFAGPKGKTIKLFFLDGIEKPYMETKQGWTVDGVEYKVRIDAGAKAMDWRGLVKNAGA